MRPTNTTTTTTTYGAPTPTTPYGGGAATTTTTTARPGVNLPLLLASLGTLLLSIPLIVTGSWLAWRSTHADCLPFLHVALLVLGCLLFVVSLLGMAAAATGNPGLASFYVFITTLIFLTLLAFTIFAFVVTHGSQHGHPVPGAVYREYRLGDYSRWMRNRVASRWPKIARCLQRNHVCSGLPAAFPSVGAFNSHRHSYIESGCCKPPSSCCYTLVTATNWVNATTPNNDHDCGRWSNDQSQLCYNCDSCKAGVIRTVNKDWRKAAKVSVAVLVALFLLWLLSCGGLPTVFRRPARTPTYSRPRV